MVNSYLQILIQLKRRLLNILNTLLKPPHTLPQTFRIYPTDGSVLMLPLIKSIHPFMTLYYYPLQITNYERYYQHFPKIRRQVRPRSFTNFYIWAQLDFQTSLPYIIPVLPVERFPKNGEMPWFILFPNHTNGNASS